MTILPFVDSDILQTIFQKYTFLREGLLLTERDDVYIFENPRLLMNIYLLEFVKFVNNENNSLPFIPPIDQVLKEILPENSDLYLNMMGFYMPSNQLLQLERIFISIKETS